MVGNFKVRSRLQIYFNCLVQETKTKLNQLFQHKMIKLQEIPKQADRAASRCVFLWSVDLNAVGALLLERAYKAQVPGASDSPSFACTGKPPRTASD